jgi:predicted dehydrogenase
VSQNQLHVGVVGVGGIARDQHMPAWDRLPFTKIVALADVSPEALDEANHRFAVPHRFRDWRELMDRDDIDVVDICTPNRTHAPIALAALARGKHVMCEKPLATTSEEVLALQEAAHRAGRLLMTAQSTRYKPVSRQLKALIDGGMLGDIYYTRAQYLRRRFLPPRPTFTERRLSGGGAVMDIGVHILDLAYWFLGCPEPLSVSAFADAPLAHRHDVGGSWGDWQRERFDVEDFAAGFIRFAGGAVLTLETSWLAFQSERELIRLQCYGTHGGLTWPEGLLLGETNKVPWSMRLDEPGTEDVYYEEIRDFAQAIRDGRPSPVPVEQTLNVIRILEAIYQSAQKKTEIVLEQQKSLRVVDVRRHEDIPCPIPVIDSVPTPLAPPTL